jgi:hypothetical protein
MGNTVVVIKYNLDAGGDREEPEVVYRAGAETGAGEGGEEERKREIPKSSQAQPIAAAQCVRYLDSRKDIFFFIFTPHGSIFIIDISRIFWETSMAERKEDQKPKKSNSPPEPKVMKSALHAHTQKESIDSRKRKS